MNIKETKEEEEGKKTLSMNHTNEIELIRISNRHKKVIKILKFRRHFLKAHISSCSSISYVFLMKDWGDSKQRANMPYQPSDQVS